MTQDDALERLSHIARERAFGRHVGSDRLIEAGLDALIAGVESPSLAMLAGLLRSEEPEAPALFDQVLEELGLLFHPPSDPRAAKWAMAYWIAGQIADGSLDPATGTHIIWADIADDLGYPEELEPLVHCAHNLDGWEESWGVSFEGLNREAVEAAKQFLSRRSVLVVHRGRLRPRYQHGCGDRCGRKPGYCPQKVNIRRETKETKSRAGRRPVGVPDELMKLLAQHRDEQERERRLARDLWVEKGYVFTSPTGEPLNPNTDHHKWKELLEAAGLRDGRLHDARHTAGTILLILGVPDTVVDSIMGWEPGQSARMRRRYQHLTDRVLKDTADKIDGLLWTRPDQRPPAV